MEHQNLNSSQEYTKILLPFYLNTEFEIKSCAKTTVYVEIKFDV